MGFQLLISSPYLGPPLTGSVLFPDKVAVISASIKHYDNAKTFQFFMVQKVVLPGQGCAKKLGKTVMETVWKAWEEMSLCLS